MNASTAALLTVDLPTARAAVLAVIQANPCCTGRELESRSKLRKLNARLSELERRDLIERAGERVCRVTGRFAETWRATGRPARAPTKHPTLAHRVALLEAELVALRLQLMRAVSP